METLVDSALLWGYSLVLVSSRRGNQLNGNDVKPTKVLASIRLSPLS